MTKRATVESLVPSHSGDLVLVGETNKKAMEGLALRLASADPPCVFVGAGLTARAGYPTWEQLLGKLMKKIEVWEKKQRPEDKGAISMTAEDIRYSPNDPSWTAQACFELFDHYQKRPDYFKFLSRQFAAKTKANATLDAVVRLPFAQFLTTNYDPSIEIAHKRIHKKSLQLVNWGLSRRLSALPRSGTHAKHCVHLHGYYKAPRGIILTEDNYQRRYFNSGIHIRKLAQFLENNPVVFIGFSLGDPDFMNLLRTLKATKRTKRGRHYAIMPLSDEKSDKHVKTEAERLDDKYNITPIFYRRLTNDFLGLDEAVKLLNQYVTEAVLSKPKAPPSRKEKSKARKGDFVFDAAALKKPKDPEDPTKGAFGGRAIRNGRRMSAKVMRSSPGSRWFRIEVTISALGRSPKLTDAGEFFVHPTFPSGKYRGKLAANGRKIHRKFWAYGAFTVGVLLDDGKTALELDLAKLKSAPKDFRDR